MRGDHRRRRLLAPNGLHLPILHTAITVRLNPLVLPDPRKCQNPTPNPKSTPPHPTPPPELMISSLRPLPTHPPTQLRSLLPSPRPPTPSPQPAEPTPARPPPAPLSPRYLMTPQKVSGSLRRRLVSLWGCLRVLVAAAAADQEVLVLVLVGLVGVLWVGCGGG